MKNFIKNKLHTILEIERLKGGLADGKTIEDIADKHDVSLSQLKQELARGTKIEMEHTNSRNIARELAMDHLMRDPKYYTKLKRFDKKLVENEVPIIGMVPNMTYNIKYHGRDCGKIIIKRTVPELGEDTAEIVDVIMLEGYTDMDTTVKTVNHIWQILPEVNRLVVMVNDTNQFLWEKLGFQRLNDTFWMSMRGH